MLERRAVGDDQDLGPALTQALGHVLEPHVLADHDTQAYRLARGQRQAHRARDRAGLEDALLVEHAVVGQGMLVDPADDGAAGEHEGGVVEPPAVAPRGTHDQGRAAIGGVAGELIQGVARMLADGRLEHQVLGRVAHQEQLGQHDEIGPGLGPLRSQPTGQGEVAGDVAHRGVGLGHGDGDHSAQGRGSKGRCG